MIPRIRTVDLQSVKSKVLFSVVLGLGLLIGIDSTKSVSVVGILLVAIFAAASVVVVLRWWRVGLLLIFVTIIFEDFVRKLIPGQPVFVFLFKDIIVLLTYIGFLVSRRFRVPARKLSILLLPLLFFFAAEVVQVFNPALPDVFLPVIALKIDFFYVPMIFLGYAWAQEKKWDSRYVKCLVFVTICLILFATYQLQFAGEEEALSIFLPTQAVGAHAFHSFGDEMVPYTFATFASGAKFAQNLLVFGIIVLSYLLRYKRKCGTMVRLFAPLPFLIGIILSGSRTPILLFFLISTVYWLVSFGLFFLRPMGLAFVGLFTIALVTIPGLNDFWLNSTRAVYMLYTLPEIRMRFFEEDEGSYDRFFIAQLRQAMEDRPFIGHGTGSNSQALGLFPEDPKYMLSAAEHGPVKVMWELGIVGLLVWVAVWIGILGSGLRVLRILRGTDYFKPAVILFVYQVSVLLWFLKGHQIMGDAQALIYFWFLLGVYHSLPRLASRTPVVGSILGLKS